MITATKPALKPSKRTLETVLPYLLVVGGILGLIAAFVISFDKQKLLENPAYQPSCNLNPIISCGSVMKSHQGSVFGFPNPWIGLVGFGILICVGMSILAGGTFKRWFWLGLEAGTVFGIGFVHWLFFQSVYRIHALCPWCMGVWVVTITIFWYVTLYNLRYGHIPLPQGKLANVSQFLQRHHLDILFLWFLMIAGLILKHFWYYFGSHL